jgi:hypothetical protein
MIKDYCDEFFQNRKIRSNMRNNLDIIVFRIEILLYEQPTKIVDYFFSKKEALDFCRNENKKWEDTMDGPDYIFRPTSLLEIKTSSF